MVQVGGAEVQQRWLARAHGLLVNDLLARSTVIVAALARSPLALAGWVVFDRPVLHYVFVATEARRLGLGRMLVDAADCTEQSHATDMWRLFAGVAT
jgi:GNAT superfamily N-acetyltransferase